MFRKKENFVVAIPIYDGVDLMDVAVPREIFSFMEEAGFDKAIQIYYVARRKRLYKTRDGLQLMPDKIFKSSKVRNPDLIWVPGGAPKALAGMLKKTKSSYFRYVKMAARRATWITSVCEGALLLANTGLLDNHEATTHWAFIPCFESFHKVKVAKGYPRYVHSGNRITGGGISSGLDEALYLVKLIAGEEVAIKVQATLQYYPKPPVMGSIPKADGCPVPGLT